MKKILVILMVFVSALAAAQDWNKYEVFAGGGMANAKSDAGMMNAIPHFQVGVKYRVGLSQGWGETGLLQYQGLYLNAGLTLLNKGHEWKVNKYGGDPKETFNGSIKALYIDFPLHFGYLLNVSDKVSVFAEGGGYVGLGLTGKFKGTIAYDGRVLEDYSNNCFSTDDDSPTVHRTEYGVGIAGGVDINGNVTITVGHDWGFSKYGNEFFLSPQHRKIYLTVGYRF
ncbi:MAG: outer membrane beta-barrel protein [Bacteroidales bacterium]|nr:outer membrane beta-barrel protein [Bacteroidales bacterium]